MIGPRQHAIRPKLTETNRRLIKKTYRQERAKILETRARIAAGSADLQRWSVRMRCSLLHRCRPRPHHTLPLPRFGRSVRIDQRLLCITIFQIRDLQTNQRSKADNPDLPLVQLGFPCRHRIHRLPRRPQWRPRLHQRQPPRPHHILPLGFCHPRSGSSGLVRRRMSHLLYDIRRQEQSSKTNLRSKADNRDQT